MADSVISIAAGGKANGGFEEQLREVNEALLLSSIRQHELAAQAQEAERQKAKALLYANDIIATLREPFVVLNNDLRVRSANRSFFDSFHVSPEETEDRLVYELGNGQWDIPALRQLLHQVLSRNRPVLDFELDHTFPSIGRKTMLLNARPFPPDSKHPELILLSMQDVTALRERADQLAEAGRRKDEFLAVLSHELRSPLAPILNAVQLLRLDKDRTQTQKEAHEVIDRQVTKLGRLIDDLLEVSRIATGRIHLQVARLDLRQIVTRAPGTTQSQAVQKAQAVTSLLPAEPVWIHGDPLRLEQVVVNLLHNASKYSDRGGQICVELHQEASEAVLCVRDNGMGISPEMLPRIFDLFAQADQSLDRSQGGLGIGLALVKSLVGMHSGSIVVRSAPDQGSEFIVRLPVSVTPDLAPAVPTIAAPEPRRALKVLVVDDNLDTAKGLSRLLQAYDYEVRHTYDGASAKKVALEFVPDVVLLDIGLPLINGYEVAKWIRQEPKLKQVLLVALTGYGLEADKKRAQEAGFDHHLVKPVNVARVLSILSVVAAN
jgi:two-component system, chemotaxis family, CheB/CheR fusion protein